ncbi:Insect cuticle protein [Trinorchestia longiramus]|nr:Insect cuticle protein [Trinorchestia longiramus]
MRRIQIFSSVVEILRDDRNGPIDGVYDFAFETADGVSRNEQGAPTGPNGAVVQQGAWSFTFPDGTPGQFNFIADEGGYRVESPLLPTPPPLPQHAIEQIEKAERERAQGIVHDGQYDASQFGGSSGGGQGFRGSSGGQAGEYGGSQSSGFGGGQSSGFGGSQSGFSQSGQRGGQRGRRVAALMKEKKLSPLVDQHSKVA